MQIKEVEKIVKVNQYVAFDGCVFDDKADCRDYEGLLHDNAVAYIKARCVKSFSGLDVAFLCESGSEYNVYYVVDVTDTETVFNLQFLLLMYTFDEQERERLGKLVNDAYNAHARVLVCCWDDDEWEWRGSYMDCLNACSKDLNRIFSSDVRRWED